MIMIDDSFYCKDDDCYDCLNFWLMKGEMRQAIVFLFICWEIGRLGLGMGIKVTND